MQARDILGAIAAGDVDDALWDINDAAMARYKIIGKSKFQSLRLGDRVRFNNEAGDRWANLEGFIYKKGRTNVTVQLEDGSHVTSNPALLKVVA
jgi:hypothetical protein